MKGRAMLDIQGLCRDLAITFTRQPSVTGTPDEAAFGPWLANYLRGLDWLAPTAEIWTFPVADGDPRHCVAALVRGTGSATVMLTGHYDTVTISDYGDLMPVATEPKALTAALLARVAGAAQGTRAARVRTDLETGQFLPGRGLLDMKAGLAAGLACMAGLMDAGALPGNLLFLAVPDEENASAGARGATRALPALLAERGLQLRAAINLDAIADDGDGDEGRVLALGTVGKVLPTALVIGTPVHSGFPLRGINAAVLAGAIAHRLEWAPELTDSEGASPGTPVSLLSLKDGKSGYDVTTPATAFAIWSVLNMSRDPASVLPRVATLIGEALTTCLHDLRKRALHADPSVTGVMQDVPIILYSDLLAETRMAWPDIDNEQAKDARRLLATGASLPDICQALTASLWNRSGRAGPAVVLGLGSVPYLATNLSDPAIDKVAQAVAASAPALYGTTLRCIPYFAGISDMSFFGQGQTHAFTDLARQTPAWDVLVGLSASDIANVPTLNLGPWGRDYHTPYERIAVDYGFRILPRLLMDLTKGILSA